MKDPRATEVSCRQKPAFNQQVCLTVKLTYKYVYLKRVNFENGMPQVPLMEMNPQNETDGELHPAYSPSAMPGAKTDPEGLGTVMHKEF